MWKELKEFWNKDNLLDECWKNSYEMLAIDELMFLEAVKTLRETETPEINFEIRRKDKLVNEYERDVRRKLLTHLAVKGTADLASAFVLVSIIGEIERIGDYTKNIVDLAETHPVMLKAGPFEDSLLEIEKHIKGEFNRTRQCLMQNDEQMAISMMEDEKAVNKLCDATLINLLSGRHDQEMTPGRAATLALYIRYLKRTNAHLKNIISSVINPFDRIGYKYKPVSE
jgi:phosphate uptake regulator